MFCYWVFLLNLDLHFICGHAGTTHYLLASHLWTQQVDSYLAKWCCLPLLSKAVFKSGKTIEEDADNDETDANSCAKSHESLADVMTQSKQSNHHDDHGSGADRDVDDSDDVDERASGIPLLQLIQQLLRWQTVIHCDDVLRSFVIECSLTHDDAV